MLKYLLDTNIVIDVIKQRPIEVKGVFNDNAGRIAAHARSEGFPLVTNNLEQFERVPGLPAENWIGAI